MQILHDVVIGVMHETKIIKDSNQQTHIRRKNSGPNSKDQ